MSALALGLLACAAALAARLRRASGRVARAEHEIRGPATAIALLAERMRREPALTTHADALEAQLDRLRAGLADLQAAREGGLPVPQVSRIDLPALAKAAASPWGDRLDFGWEGGGPEARTDRHRVAQALGNLLANAAEHGSGTVRLRGRRSERGVEIEVRNGLPSAAGRGRGLGIAAEAARAAGGRLRFDVEDGVAVARLELPADGFADAA